MATHTKFSVAIKSWAFACSAAVVLTACGGSSGDSSGDEATPAQPPEAVSPSAAVSPQSMDISWNSVSDATSYQVSQDLDGSSGFTIIAENLTDTSIQVPLPTHLTDWENARYMVEACNSAGCTPSTDLYIAGQTLDAIGYLKPDVIREESRFGFSMAITPDGQTLAVGAPQYDLITSERNEKHSGAVFIYSNTATGWNLVQKIENPVQQDTDWDFFGYSLAISDDGSSLLIGAPSEDGGGNAVNADMNQQSGFNSGAGFLYQRSGEQWQLSAYLKAANADRDDYFGLRVAMSGDGSTLAVSAPYEASDAAGVNPDDSDNSIELAGAVYTFEQVEGQWQQTNYIKPSTGSYFENFCFDPRPPNSPTCYAKSPSKFGYGLALSDAGDVLVVGAPGDSSASAGINGAENDYRAKSSGAVHVLRKGDTGWTHTDYIKSINPDIDDEFGLNLALSGDGNTLAIAAPYEDSYYSGITHSDSLAFESADETEQDSGAIYIVSYSADEWAHRAFIKAPRPDENDLFGWGLGLSENGDLLAVGAPRDDSEATGINGNWDNSSAPAAGAVSVYGADDSDTWSMINYVKASNTDANDTFGRTLALSADGQVLAVAATGEDSQATENQGDQSDDTGNNSGAIYIY
ncbi:hypothetical protein QWI17_20810 [Gilvimarinus sp. SDUM040013]|uniref:Fibronectin type-III domain-containing protein n=1 Tax=Gilvimarinus gilvus TaxID=3058038 RepID=A0ABU4RSH1_9GAMM|nr:hypothetical protein [Gilvimarinus sp. SDUM040013]MDO3388300.1 hypothetical protein [Gilvimarinus sp. SDUM040013]MDX6847850.1 hypothetical protein [Gilvimarinus sp. SDUM040013]